MFRHQSGLDRPVSTSTDSLFKCLPSRHRPFGLQFSIIFVTLLLFILVTCRSKFCYLLIFSSTGSTFNSSQFLHSFCDQKCEPALLLENCISIDVNSSYHFLLGSKFRFHVKECGQPVRYVLCFLNIFGPKMV
jgi:hypothetical protein